MDGRERRIGENEALFRVVNEQATGMNVALADVTESFTIVCECGQIECLERLRVPPDVYERTRAHGARFFVLRGHVIPDTESVVDEGDGYLIVEKDAGEPADLAEALDPRE